MLVQSLGLGLPYIASLPPELYQSGVVDFIEITPETLCRERRDGPRVVIDLIPGQLGQAQRTCGALPIVVHGVELSIGSAHGCNTAYLDMLDEFQAHWPFIWHSEHLGFQTIPGDDGNTLEIGVPLPLPATKEAVRLVSERTRLIRARYGVPFLLENPAHYLSGLPSDGALSDDGAMMQAVIEQGECSQLLDLHNVYCNAVNHGFDPFGAIDRMPLDHVVEIHIAGGSWRDGFWMDAHDNRVPERVWDLLDYTLRRTENVSGVVFEVLEEHAGTLGATAIVDELTRARQVWCRYRSG